MCFCMRPHFKHFITLACHEQRRMENLKGGGSSGFTGATPHSPKRRHRGDDRADYPGDCSLSIPAARFLTPTWLVSLDRGPYVPQGLDRERKYLSRIFPPLGSQGARGRGVGERELSRP